MKDTFIRSLIGRLGPNQEVRIRPENGDRLVILVGNHEVVGGDRETVIRLLEDWYVRPTQEE